jgi:hypothetical protein
MRLRIPAGMPSASAPDSNPRLNEVKPGKRRRSEVRGSRGPVAGKGLDLYRTRTNLAEDAAARK